MRHSSTRRSFCLITLCAHHCLQWRTSPSWIGSQPLCLRSVVSGHSLWSAQAWTTRWVATNAHWSRLLSWVRNFDQTTARLQHRLSALESTGMPRHEQSWLLAESTTALSISLRLTDTLCRPQQNWQVDWCSKGFKPARSLLWSGNLEWGQRRAAPLGFYALDSRKHIRCCPKKTWRSGWTFNNCSLLGSLPRCALSSFQFQLTPDAPDSLSQAFIGFGWCFRLSKA